jgi:catechol 2,3-dioxygenase-like lactoylglutathione lyase family enzyme
MIENVDHLAMYVSDIERSIAFYRDVLGFEETLRWETNIPGVNQISFMKKCDGVIELFEIEGAKPLVDDPEMVGFKHLCVEVSDFDEEFERITGMGVKVLEEPHVLNSENLVTKHSTLELDMERGLKRAVFADPDGLPIEILYWL